MKHLYTLILLLNSLFFLSATKANPQLELQIKGDLEEYQSLVEQALAYREVTLDTYQIIKDKMQKDIPLSGKDIETLNTGTLQHLALRKKLYSYVGYYEYLLNDKYDSIDKEARLRGIMLSLSAALVLYDNYLLSITIFEEDAKLRRYLNAKHDGYNIKNYQLNEITLQYNSIENRNRARRAIDFFKTEWQKQSYEFRHQPYNIYLNLLITQSPSYNHIREFSPLYVVNQKTRFLTGITSDTLSKLGKEGVNLFSLLFGNSIGVVEVRKGLLNNDINVETQLTSRLKAGDILLEKTPFRLTDKLIPGYWGHVAIWVGSEEELKQLGIWNHPVVKKHHQQIKSSQLVAEALRAGVELNSLNQFMNVDDLAVLRKNKLDDKTRAETIIRALRQIGKAYDFNFDIETNDKIVCSELIYVSFTETQWPTEATLGRHTISPSNIAIKAGDELPFKVVSLYLHGKPVNSEIHSEFSKLNIIN
ncbi:MAG: Poxvirus G6 [endosymbiont of Galathealinum brachiosum]|uniref:Poxvirus G6 n=1 Tax=endosymbiont of Galathealinum brachiosum TaxID=2200906 RepID=A0A370DK21_9GAMM|nr:MAG: Poxvirus G6 [endosymbiont of Galathealinum brachiosum]